MKKLSVELGERSYPIYIGFDLIQNDNLLKSHIHGRQVCVVTNETIAPLYLNHYRQSLGSAGFEVSTVVLPDGESHKNLATLDRIFSHLLEQRFDRSCTLIALGGGVVGDMTGFAAASYQRGINFIQVPTTLLSMVDSSVGGKTGVNHALGKNMIGAFYQPQAVIADVALLASLPRRELAAGVAEVIKYGLICDAPFFNWLESNIDSVMAGNVEALSYCVERSCDDKAKVVAQDEREGGVRAILNLGHTFGHAIENAQGYGVWLHGEAVATGMLMAIDLSVRMGLLASDVLDRSIKLIELAGLPIKGPANMTNQQYLDLMSVDKKVQDGQLRLILLKSLGEAFVTSDIDSELLLQTLDAFRT
ncbi:3-dehydroquinate synthase [Gilvimarinus sp. SDUM040013]|uniref:3-dehydroquinate synthase n=1 Tax=Gilvimarinus gilvus TaxID=3058038 RepID=A0ABU4S025_9GAMM|nr:3-dehydroquinate synthase [Gilvimarinus sp. SDUM040013]MDO3387384.1 3-dehydroquinate synthase [Gilvimarinus sp. SDUM040013]MDX6849861.1 3-dehydroquinate synthase [Gilvimarinus sp. SDUM040013]